ncbi:MAG: TIGR03086 family metal-binding protein [Pseudonocardiaceae bacterium]
MTSPTPSVESLTEALRAVGDLISGIRDDQWSAPTPCTDWTVRDVIYHLVGINLVFVARLNDQVPPERGTDVLGDNPTGAYRDSGIAVRAVFEHPGVLERTYHSPLGAATGAELLHWRIADLLAHGWDLARATGQPAQLPEDLAEQALVFARVQLATQPRTGRFNSAQPVVDDAPAIDRLVAFLGRPVGVS